MSRITAEYARGSEMVNIGSTSITLAHRPGEVVGVTPTDLSIAALAACMASEGREYLKGRGLARDVSVACDFEMDGRCPGLIARIQYRVVVRGDLPPGRGEGLVRCLDHRATPLLFS
jgi:uncharacterized OsmC-like protein